MSETTELPAVKSEAEILIEKRKVWSDMGEATYKKELQLQGKAQQLIAKLITPTSMEDVVQAEEMLKEVKREAKLLQGERNAITSKFDALKERLMLSEKSIDAPVLAVTNAIITIKQAHEQQQRKVQAKADEVRRLREGILLTKNEIDASFKNKVVELVAAAYTNALTTKVDPNKIGAYLNEQNAKVDVRNFVFVPTTPALVYVTKEEYTTMYNELFDLNNQTYVDLFREQLDIRFDDYSIAFNNAEQALKIATTESEEKKAEITSEKNVVAVAAKLEAAASPVVQPELSFDTKGLKKSFEVDMTESLENSIIVMGAFVANVEKVKHMMKVNKWDSFNIGQMKNYLGKLKSADNNFQSNGIIWKEVSKL